ncbi:MAG: sortase [Patescibacteria group bacterium]
MRYHRLTSKWSRILPAVLVTMGSVLIANIAWPIISYQLFVSPLLQQSTLNSPISQEQMAQYQRVVAPVRAEEPQQQKILLEPTIIPEEQDYTNLATWFPNQNIPDVSPENAKAYMISIPALNIEKAVVKIGGLSLEKNLIQYPGTANPGELGSPIIFGHSVSPLFYNPSITNPRRYTSLFTKIMNLKKDDKIIVEYDGITYTYRVTNKIEVKPDDTYILEQRYDARELKLVTCTPPGTLLRRGIVFAQLEDLQHEVSSN